MITVFMFSIKAGRGGEQGANDGEVECSQPEPAPVEALDDPNDWFAGLAALRLLEYHCHQDPCLGIRETLGS